MLLRVASAHLHTVLPHLLALAYGDRFAPGAHSHEQILIKFPMTLMNFHYLLDEGAGLALRNCERPDDVPICTGGPPDKQTCA